MSLVAAVAAENALQARASGSNHVLSPVINVATDPRFGRTQEAFGEDPFIVGTMSAAAVASLQGPAPTLNGSTRAGPSSYLIDPEVHVVSQAKHFFAYAHGGRDGAATLLDERTLDMVYGNPWRRAIAKSNLRGVMASHNSVNYEPMHGSSRWLTRYLRGQLGFGDGYIGADSHNVLALYSAQKVVGSAEAAAALAVTAGLDQDLNTMVNTPFSTLAGLSNMSAALRASIDRAAGNVLRLKFAARLFDTPLANLSLWPARDSPRARALARVAAEEGCVLLINRRRFAKGPPALPLAKTGPLKIAVIGPNADAKDNTLGDYNPSAAKSEAAWGGNKTVSTVLSGLKAYAAGRSAGVTVTQADGCDLAPGSPDAAKLAEAVALHQRSDVTVVVVGDSSAGSAGFAHETCGEGADRHSLDLYGQQLELLTALAGANATAKLIVVLIHGRPVTFGDSTVLAKVDAMLAAWRPGEEGGTAVASLLFGDVSPSGKLTQAWPLSADAVNSPSNPWFQANQADGGGKPNSNKDGGNTVLFPFGFGLTCVNCAHR